LSVLVPKAARSRFSDTRRCRFTESRRAFETPGCVKACALRAVLAAVCARRARGRVRRRRAATKPPFCPRGGGQSPRSLKGGQSRTSREDPECLLPPPPYATGAAPG